MTLKVIFKKTENIEHFLNILRLHSGSFPFTENEICTELNKTCILYMSFHGVLSLFSISPTLRLTKSSYKM